MPSKHPEVPATKANCEKDYQDKLKLEVEFEEFKKLIEQAGQRSPEVKELLIPLKKLEQALVIAAHGPHFVLEEPKKR